MRLLQQMALRKCVIVSDTPSVQDYVEEGITARVYKAHHPEELEKIMRWAVEKEREKEDIANKAFNFVKNECNEEIMASNIECFNMKLLNK